MNQLMVEIQYPATEAEWKKDSPEQWEKKKIVINFKDVRQIDVYTWGFAEGMIIRLQDMGWHFTMEPILFIG